MPLFPRSSERGSIEASFSRQVPNRLLPGFHVRVNVAPLKQALDGLTDQQIGVSTFE